MFTQKHYVAIADVIHAQRLEAREGAEFALGGDLEVKMEHINKITLALAKLFKEDNPKFKEFTFIATCNRDLKSQ